MQLTRREFLITGGAACAAASAQAAPSRRVIYAGATEGKSVPVERSLLTLCRQCPGGCGLRVRVVDDRVVGIAGNPDHPINRGGMCARAPAAVQSLYNPDRLTRPMALDGVKGSGNYRPLEWDEAAGSLAERLKSIRQTPGPHSVAVVINGDRGLRRLLWSRFLQAYGSNNLIDWSFPEGHRAYPAVWAMQGLRRAVGNDLARTQYVLSFSSQWLDAHWSPAQACDAFSALRSSREIVRPKFVHIEPRLSLTGAKANEWIPIRPGTEGALALGIAHVLLREGLFDQEFVKEHTHGFEDPEDGGAGDRIGYRRLVLRDYAPSKVARITGVEEGTIFRIAREFASNKPALAIGFDGSGVSTQRCYDRMAIHSLNALVGSIDVPGGATHFQDIDLLNLPFPQSDSVAETGLDKPRIDSADLTAYPLADNAPHLLAERIPVELPYPISVLILAGGDPVFDSPDRERMKQALAKVPFVVSLSPWMNDSARWADLIIPDAHFLTRWDVDFSHTLTGQPAVTIGRPVVSPPDGKSDSAELILDLARRIGEPVSTALPFKTPQDAVRAVCDRLHNLGRGGPFGPEEQEGWTRLLENSGWRFPPATGAGQSFSQILKRGGWTDPIYYHREWDRVFRAPPRRFAFHSLVIAERVKPRSSKGDVRCLPHYEDLYEAKPDVAFPLRLYLYPLPTLAGLEDTNLPWLMDACGAYMSERWRSWVEINPETAGKLGIADGDTVDVTSRRGKIRLRARLFQGITPDVIAIPWGLGRESGGRWCEGIGQSPTALVEVRTDPLTSGSFWNATRVSLHKV